MRHKQGNTEGGKRRREGPKRRLPEGPKALETSLAELSLLLSVEGIEELRLILLLPSKSQFIGDTDEDPTRRFNYGYE